MDLRDEQWNRVEPCLRKAEKPSLRGRPEKNPRDVVNGILWVLRENVSWQNLPRRYPPYQTCNRWFRHWRESGVLGSFLKILADDLHERGKIDLPVALRDLSLGDRKFIVDRNGVKLGPKSWQWQTARIFLSPGVRKELPKSITRFHYRGYIQEILHGFAARVRHP